jgi:nucleotide-binding universal stress UspA family protein
MKPFNKLFAAIEPTRASQNAVDYAVRLALYENTTVTFCHGVDLAPEAAGGTGFSSDRLARLSGLRREGRLVLDAAQTTAFDRSVPASALELTGSTACATVNAARNRGVSAIVVGAEPGDRGATSVGTLAEAVLRLSDRPVILVSRPSVAAAPMASIVVAIDGSQAAKSALDFALDVAEGGLVQVVAVHVRPRYETDAGIRKARPLLEDVVAYAARRNIKIEAALARGRVVDELATAVKVLKADLLVVGTDGPGTLRALPFPSIARCVSRAIAVPVAVVRAAQHERAYNNLRLTDSIAS